MTEPVDSLSSLRFDADGLIPVVIQDAGSAAVLMVAFMNEEALRLTRETGRTHFWSRSRQKLWRKGEISGHEQIVRDIFVNCKLNTLLIEVDQIEAVCHEGYPTCFYRRVDEEGNLSVVRERWFDPRDVYAVATNGEATPGEPMDAIRSWFGAYEYLCDNDLSAVSSTSKRLHGDVIDVERRIADELRELAGVLDGSHRHDSLVNDVILEASQVCYWVVVSAVGSGIDWRRLRPDRALQTTADAFSPAFAANLLQNDARSWDSGPAEDQAARLHRTLAFVAQACQSAGVAPRDVIAADLADLKAKAYLAPYFASL